MIGSRPRGIVAFDVGKNNTSTLTFALGAHSQTHIYSTTLSHIAPLTSKTYHHNNFGRVSFAGRISVSPCGNWLAAIGGLSSSVYLYDITNTIRRAAYTTYPLQGTSLTEGVELEASPYVITAIDWANGGILATSTKDGKVRVWRPTSPSIEQQ